MIFKRFSFLALISVVAAEFNSVISPGQNAVMQAGGGAFTLAWNNLTAGNVSVALYSGSNPVTTVTPIVSSIMNTGAYVWSPETWLPSGDDYTVGVTPLEGGPTSFSNCFTVQLCSKCSSSTRSTTSSFQVQTISVAALGALTGTKTNNAFAIASASDLASASLPGDSGFVSAASAAATPNNIAVPPSVRAASASALALASGSAKTSGALSAAATATAAAGGATDSYGNSVAAAKSASDRIMATTAGIGLGVITVVLFVMFT